MPVKYKGKGGFRIKTLENSIKHSTTTANIETNTKITTKYEGQLNSKGNPDGLGIETNDDYEYKGHFKDGNKVGIGVYRYKDGTVVKINFVDKNETYGIITYPTGRKIISYTGAIDPHTITPTYGKYILKDAIIIGKVDQKGGGVGKNILNTSSPTNHYYLGDINNFKPEGLGYVFNKDRVYTNQIGNFVDGKLTGLGKGYNTNKMTEYGIGEFKDNLLDGLGEKYTPVGTLEYAVLQKGNFKNNYLKGFGVKEWPDWQPTDKYKEFDNYSYNLNSANKQYLYYNPESGNYISTKNDNTAETAAKKLEDSVKTVVDNANTVVQSAEVKKGEAEKEATAAEAAAKTATQLEKTTVEEDVNKAINVLKQAAEESYEEKIADVKPKEQDRKYDILEIHDYTYAGQVNSDKKPHGYGVKTYKDNQRKMEGIFKDGLFVFGKFTNGDKNSSGFFDKGVLTGFGKDNDGAYSDIHSESVKELFSKNAAGKDQYLVAEIEKNLDNDVKKAINAAIKSAEDAAKIKFDTLIDGVVTKPDENVKVVIENKPDFTFVGQNTGYGVKTYTNGKKSRAGIFIENKLSFGESLDGDTKLYGFFKEALPYICVNEDGTPVDNQPFSDKHFLDYIGKHLKTKVDTVVENAKYMKAKKETDVADETKKAEEAKQAQDNYKTKIAEVPAEVSNPEYGIIDIEQEEAVFTSSRVVIYEYKGQVHNKEPDGYGILYNNKNNQIMKGFFEKGKLFFGTKDGIGSGFFSGAKFWGAQLNGFGRNNNAVFSDAFQHNRLPNNLTKFDEGMKGKNEALVKVIRDNLDNDLETVFKKAQAAAKTAQEEADKKAQAEADQNAKIKKETQRLADQTAQTAAQNEYNTIIRQPVLKEDHFVYECKIDNYIYTGGVDTNGKPHGVGKQVYSNETYEGTFKHGKRDGLGKLVYNPANSGWTKYYGQHSENEIRGVGLAIIDGKTKFGKWFANGSDSHVLEKPLLNEVTNNLQTDVDNFLRDKIKIEDIIKDAKTDAKKIYDKKLAEIKNQNFSNLKNGEVKSGLLNKNYYKGQVNNKGERYGYGVYTYKNEIKTGIFENGKILFGKLEKVDELNNINTTFMGFFPVNYSMTGMGYFPVEKKYSDFLDSNGQINSYAQDFGDSMKGKDRVLIEVLKEKIETDVNEVVAEAMKQAGIESTSTSGQEKTDQNGTNWKKIGLASAAVGLGAAGIYYLHKKHKEYKQSKKSNPRGKQTRSKRSKPSNRRTRSKRSDREQRRSGSGSTRSSSRSNAENRRTRSKRSDNQRRSKRSSRKTRRSSQRSSE
jgi:hypothetical protein